MVEETTLSVSIDASGAKEGATIFSRSVDDIKKKAEQLGRIVKSGNQAFRNMKGAQKGVPNLVETNLVTRALADASKLQTTVAPIVGIILTIIGILLTGFDIIDQNLKEAKRLRTDRAQRLKELDKTAKIETVTAQEGTGARQNIAKTNASEARGEQFLLEKEIAQPLNDLVKKQQAKIEESEKETGRTLFLDRPDLLSPGEKLILGQQQAIEKKFREPLAKLAALGEMAAFAEAIDRGEEDLLSGKAIAIPSELSDSPLQNEPNAGPFKQQIDDTNRSIDLLKEQKSAIEENAAAANAQKEQELELLQREKECLERLNEALQENQTLRGLSGDQSDDILEGAAAYDDLSTAVDENGEAAKGLKDQVDALNTVLQSNADINTQIVGGLEKERDKRQQVNGTIVERRRLEEEQKQSLIQAEDETERRGKAVEASIEQIKDAAADSFKDVIKGTESVGDAFQKLADRITDILLDLALDELLKGGTGFSDLFGAVFGGIGSAIGGGGGGDPLGLLTPAAFGGGIVPFHTGGIVGLRPDEIPIIAQRGEEVLTRNDPRHRDNGAVGGGNVVVNVSFPNARNTGEARQAGSEIAAKAAAAAQRGMARKGIG